MVHYALGSQGFISYKNLLFKSIFSDKNKYKKSSATIKGILTIMRVKWDTIYP